MRKLQCEKGICQNKSFESHNDNVKSVSVFKKKSLNKTILMIVFKLSYQILPFANNSSIPVNFLKTKSSLLCPNNLSNSITSQRSASCTNLFAFISGSWQNTSRTEN